MAHWLNLGQHLKIIAKRHPDTIALKERYRTFTYPELNRRVNRLAHSLLGLGLQKGDKVAVIMENAVEIVEIYLATAKTGLVIVPINFRQMSKEIAYIIKNADAKAVIIHDQFIPLLNPIRKTLYNIFPDSYIVVGEELDDYRPYEAFINHSNEHEPNTRVLPGDTWILIYTSGTTGKPKGVVRSHESHVAFYLINAVDFGFNASDICMNIMPLCHINSTFFTFAFLYIGATVYIHPAQSFNAEEILEIVEREKITFISLIPTHYNMILNAPESAKHRDRSSIRKLLCSSAPVRKSMKKAIMAFFPHVELYEGYGSTEAGIVTILKPEEQIKKLGSIGYESLGTEFIKILDLEGNPVPTGEVGELYSCGPMLFDQYYKFPEKTAEVFRDGWFTAGDLAKADEAGYYYIVDRKDNMIITGGEHVYPSEVEEVVGSHPQVFDVAVIPLPDEKWGEKVTAVVIQRPNADISKSSIMEWCRDKLAGYKRPKDIRFIPPEEMPRTATGKILHRVLRERFRGT